MNLHILTLNTYKGWFLVQTASCYIHENLNNMQLIETAEIAKLYLLEMSYYDLKVAIHLLSVLWHFQHIAKCLYNKLYSGSLFRCSLAADHTTHVKLIIFLSVPIYILSDNKYRCSCMLLPMHLLYVNVLLSLSVYVYSYILKLLYHRKFWMLPMVCTSLTFKITL